MKERTKNSGRPVLDDHIREEDKTRESDESGLSKVKMYGYKEESGRRETRIQTERNERMNNW
jgi:hypothetical protein